MLRMVALYLYLGICTGISVTGDGTDTGTSGTGTGFNLKSDFFDTTTTSPRTSSLRIGKIKPRSSRTAIRIRE
jgi:hypothetical protein